MLSDIAVPMGSRGPHIYFSGSLTTRCSERTAVTHTDAIGLKKTKFDPSTNCALRLCDKTPFPVCGYPPSAVGRHHPSCWGCHPSWGARLRQRTNRERTNGERTNDDDENANRHFGSDRGAGNANVCPNPKPSATIR